MVVVAGIWWFDWASRSEPMRQAGFTVYQLLVSIVLIGIAASLWLAFTKHQGMKQQQQSCLPEVRHG